MDYVWKHIPTRARFAFYYQFVPSRNAAGVPRECCRFIGLLGTHFGEDGKLGGLWGDAAKSRRSSYGNLLSTAPWLHCADE